MEHGTGASDSMELYKNQVNNFISHCAVYFFCTGKTNSKEVKSSFGGQNEHRIQSVCLSVLNSNVVVMIFNIAAI